MTDPKPGVKTALELATAGAIREAKADGHVIEGLGLPLIPSSNVETVTGANGVREPGRPKGARNKRTLAMLRYVETRYRNPLIVLAEIRSRPVELLRQELQCTLEEAMRLQVSCAIAELPYWNQKLPQAIELEISDTTSDQRSDAEIRKRVLALAEQLGVTLTLPAIPEKDKEKQ